MIPKHFRHMLALVRILDDLSPSDRASLLSDLSSYYNPAAPSAEPNGAPKKASEPTEKAATVWIPAHTRLRNGKRFRVRGHHQRIHAWKGRTVAKGARIES